MTGSIYDLFDKRVTPAAPTGSTGEVSAYAATALEQETGRVATAPEGTRNDTLYQGTFALGQLVAGGEIPEQVARDRLTLAAQRAGLGTRETEATIDSGMDAGAGYPRTASNREATPSVSTLASGTASDDFNGLVAAEARHIRVRNAARDLIRAEEVGRTEPPAPLDGAEFLAQPDEAPPLVHGLIPRTGKFLVAAQAKTGKTRTAHHVIRSLLTGEAMFDHFPVDTAEQLNVHLVDNEMSPGLLRRWLRDLLLTEEQLARLTVHPLLGYASTFDPTIPENRARWAERLRGGDVVILDCLSPFIQAAGLDENKDAGRWLGGLDELMAAAGVPIYGVFHHAGHGQERARGDSKILGWPFQLWTLSREATDADDDGPDDAPRFLKAPMGRCGSVPSGRMELSADGSRLTYLPGATRAKTRREAAEERNLTEVLAAMNEHLAPGESVGVGKVAEWVGKDAKTVRPALNRGVGNGVLKSAPYPGGSGHVFSLVSGHIGGGE